jgi:fructokinase
MKDPAHFTTFAFVSLMESGERDFYFNRGADGQLSIDEIEMINLDEFSIIHFGSATGFFPGPLQEAYSWLLKKALEKNIFTSFDPNFRHLLFQNNEQSFIDQSWHFLRSCNFFKLSDEEAMLITGSFNAEAAASILLKKTNAVFAITLGKQGTLFGHQGKMQVIPSIKVNVVDTTGAGDAFAGAVLYQLNNTNSSLAETTAEEWEKIIFNANKAGARTCEYLGAMEAFQHLDKNIFH